MRGTTPRSCMLEALEIDVTSDMRAIKVHQTTLGRGGVCIVRSGQKEAYKDTLAQCTAQGFAFTPIHLRCPRRRVGVETRRVMAAIAQRQAGCGDWCKEGTVVRLVQRLSATLQQENACTIAKWLRLAPDEPSFRLGAAQGGRLGNGVSTASCRRCGAHASLPRS